MVSTVELTEFAVIGSALVSWVAVVIALVCLIKVKRQAALSEKLHKDLKHEMQVTNNGSIGMGRRLLTMEKAVAAVQAAPVQSASPVAEAPGPVLNSNAESPPVIDAGEPVDEEMQAFTQAAELLNAGLDAESVAQRCGLSRAETSLMQLMQHQSVSH